MRGAEEIRGRRKQKEHRGGNKTEEDKRGEEARKGT